MKGGTTIPGRRPSEVVTYLFGPVGVRHTVILLAVGGIPTLDSECPRRDLATQRGPKTIKAAPLYPCSSVNAA